MNQVSKETAGQIAVEHLKRQKCTEKIYVAMVEISGDCWIVRGMCPIDLLGKPWAEKFEVLINAKGKVKSTNCALL